MFTGKYGIVKILIFPKVCIDSMQSQPKSQKEFFK